MNWTEILGFVTGAASVALAVRESAWNWPVGIANNIFFLVLFWKVKLYADAVLQIVYVIISIFGWWNWIRGGVGHSRLPVTRTPPQAILPLFLISVLATAVITYALHSFTDSAVPFWDGLTTALSLIAQYMLSRKLLENWWIWMIADIVYIALYCYKALYLTGILYLVFFAMCIAGYVSWTRSLTQAASERAAT